MRDGLTAAATLTVDRPAGRQRIRWTHAWPVVLRPTGDERVHLVHGAGGPLGGDGLSLTVHVAGGAALSVRSAGATLVQPGLTAAAARWDTKATVGAGGWLDWAPEPTIVTDGATYDTSMRVELARGASAAIREIVVLGRYGGQGGRHRGEQTVTVDGVPLLAHAAVLDGADAALGGPGGSAGARSVGTLVLAGDRSGLEGFGADGGHGQGERAGLRWAWTPLDGPGRVLLAVGDPGPVTALLDSVSALIASAARDHQVGA